MIEKFFRLKENNTNVKTEVLAGITTFMTMAYILAVNPDILSVAMGADNKGAIFTATALAAIVGTLCMALFANYPFALAPGMGLNAFFAFSVCLGMGKSWQFALTAVLVEGILFILLSFFNVREAIFDAIPMNLKHAVGAGIGLFISFIGFQNSKIVIADGATKVKFFSLKALDQMDLLQRSQKLGVPVEQLTSNINFSNAGITMVLALLGIIITAVLLIRKVKGGILWGILITYALGLISEATGLYVPYIDGGYFSLFPSFANGIAIPSIKNIAFKFEFGSILTLDFLVVMFAFLFVDIFDTLGTLIGVCSKANMLDKNGKLPKIKGALLADAVGTLLGACFGTSTTTTYVESASGVSEGGRTGLTAFVVAILFALSLFLSPIFLAIPAFATTPALVIVGFYMIGSIVNIDFDDFTEGIPAFLAFVAMPFTYSISEGIVFGIVSYTLINVIAGKAKKVNILMYILSVLFVLKYIFI